MVLVSLHCYSSSCLVFGAWSNSMRGNRLEEFIMKCPSHICNPCRDVYFVHHGPLVIATKSSLACILILVLMFIMFILVLLLYSWSVTPSYLDPSILVSMFVMFILVLLLQLLILFVMFIVFVMSSCCNHDTPPFLLRFWSSISCLSWSFLLHPLILLMVFVLVFLLQL